MPAFIVKIEMPVELTLLIEADDERQAQEVAIDTTSWVQHGGVTYQNGSWNVEFVEIDPKDHVTIHDVIEQPGQKE